MLIFHPQLQLCRAQCCRPRLSRKHALVELNHQRLGRAIGHLPKTHHQRPGSREPECSAQTEDTFSGENFAKSGVARREASQLCIKQVQARHILRGKETGFRFWRGIYPA